MWGSRGPRVVESFVLFHAGFPGASQERKKVAWMPERARDESLSTQVGDAVDALGDTADDVVDARPVTGKWRGGRRGG